MRWEGIDLEGLWRLHPTWKPTGSAEAGYTARSPADPQVVLYHRDALTLSFMIRRVERQARRAAAPWPARLLARWSRRAGRALDEVADLPADLPAGVAADVARR